MPGSPPRSARSAADVRVVATAGHVDHGKSSLVLALTGTDPDRFPEEKRRGLTIDLGFAFCALPSGTEVGFVDVPGHVRFIKNMLAGVGAVQVAILVVAANEGWMPQSEEHLRILDRLGVAHGLTVLTKADLVGAETLELAALDLEDRLAGTTFAGAPLVACDSRSGRGIDAVRDALDAVLTAAPPAVDLGRPRLWVDRVFAAKGSGTVVTGTLTGGAFAVDDDVRAGHERARVRGIESRGRPLEVASPGARIALNLAGIEHRALARGDAVVRPDDWLDVMVVDAAVTPLPGELPKRRGQLQAYVGAGEHRVWLRALDEDARYARIRFDVPLPLAPGDRLVLRDPGRGSTVAGAEVLELAPRGRAKDAPAHLARSLAERELASGWVPLAGLGPRTGLPEPVAVALLEAAGGIRRGSWLVEPTALAGLRSETHALVREHHRAHPHAPGLDAAAVANGLHVPVDRLHTALDDDDELVVERGLVREATHLGRPSDSDEARVLLATLEAALFAPTAPDDLALARALVREGAVVELDGVYFSTNALDRARELVLEALRERASLTVADVRDVLGSTRKYVLPIVNRLDAEGVTRRRGDDRVPGPASGL